MSSVTLIGIDIGKHTFHLHACLWQKRGQICFPYSNFDTPASNQYGKFEVKESLFMGPSGKAANFQNTLQILDDGARKLSTVIPLH